ncbi:MAG: GNAT family N-acetyltransferase [Defluviitaleaceae bacterium]|nr:GNAT family N-acetyltransferase [Defluviitaleaceae bacterium]
MEVRFVMSEMGYKGGLVQSALHPALLTREYFERYVELVDACFYKMREELNIRPYGKHSYSLGSFDELSANTYLLTEGGEVVGAVTCNGNDIGNVVVNPKFQGKGHGRKLVEFAISHMQKQGIDDIKLTVADWNVGAIGLYESLGFEIQKSSLIKGENMQNFEGEWGFRFVETEGLDIR